MVSDFFPVPQRRANNFYENSKVSLVRIPLVIYLGKAVLLGRFKAAIALLLMILRDCFISNF